jgi:retron-type reverse transcriptase
VVDIDLSKFFDRVNHDRLLARLATRIRDKRVLKLIRRFLTSGVMIGGLEEPTEEGTPQGGPLSPILSNVVLDEPCQRQINLTKRLRNADCALFVMPTTVSFSSEANGQGAE